MNGQHTQAQDNVGDAARRHVLEAVLREGSPAVIVDSPPGAGKTDLIEAVVATAVRHAQWRVAIATPKTEQAYDLVRRVRADYPSTPLELFHSERRPPPPDLGEAGVRLVKSSADLGGGARAIVSTADKLLYSVPQLTANEFDLLVVDEAYQLAAKGLDPILHLAHRCLLVGDPGQLPPLVRGDVARFEAARIKVHWPAPRELLRRHPNLPRISLPATYRLPQDTVDFVQSSFYPDLPFVSAASPEARRVRYVAAGLNTPVDRALDLIAEGATLVALVLPRRALDDDVVDEEVALLAAEVIDRLLKRGVEWVGERRLMSRDVGYVDAHVASNAAVERHLRRLGVASDAMASTPEIWQGLQRPIMVAKHTLSGVSRPDAFALEPGRLCVMTSRHQLACIVVGRDGVGAALEGHHHDCASRPSGSEDVSWAGWRAHNTLWSTLEQKGRIVRLDRVVGSS